MNLGNPAENRTASILEDFGYLVSSRRHRKGPGDLLAVSDFLMDFRPLLIEVKKTVDGPFKNFSRADRAAMIEVGVGWNVTPLLAWWPWSPGEGKQPIWLPVEDWPA